jgi:hypothetical protein
MNYDNAIKIPLKDYYAFVNYCGRHPENGDKPIAVLAGEVLLNLASSFHERAHKITMRERVHFHLAEKGAVELYLGRETISKLADLLGIQARDVSFWGERLLARFLIEESGKPTRCDGPRPRETPSAS